MAWLMMFSGLALALAAPAAIPRSEPTTPGLEVSVRLQRSAPVERPPVRVASTAGLVR
jgi:hypothetical protein